MLFYLLFVPTTVLLLVMILDLRRHTKHDRVLFRFCQIRRDIVALLSVESCTFSKSDYRVLRTLIDTTSATIHHFNHLKVTAFNFRQFIAWFKEYRKNAKQIDDLATTNSQINKIKNSYRVAMLHAFLSYTPLMRSQIVVELFIAVLGFILRLGIKSLQIEKSVNYLSWFKKEITEFSNHRPQHA